MGQSTNAILFYGYCWEDETSSPWIIGRADDAPEDENEEEDWKKRYVTRCGLVSPSRQFPTREVPRTRENNFSCTPTDYTADEQSVIDEHRAYWAAERALVDASWCEVDQHCSAECPMQFVAVKASRRISHRGDATPIDDLRVDPTWDVQLAEFCTLMEIPVQESPRWYLVSYWSGA